MIFPDLTKLQIYIRPGITDMRKQINGLSIITEEDMELNPLSGHLFLFCGRTRKQIKCLYWDRTGFCLWQKNLSQDRFPWPNTEEQVRTIDLHQLTMLLNGIDFWKQHKTIFYQEIN